MNSVTSIRRNAERGRNLATLGFLCWLLLAGGCQPDRKSGAPEEEAPATTETGEAGAPMADTSPAPATDNNVVDSGNPFCLELTSARERVMLGEPLTLIVALRNCSEEMVQVRDLLAPEYGLLSISIGHPQKEQEQIYSPLARRDGRGKGYVDLDAGEILSAIVPVYFGRDGWQIDAPGSYTFRADYFVDDISLASNVVTVDIENPQNEADLSAAKMLMSPDAATFFFLGGGAEKGADELRSLVTERPESLWADYANLGLAIASASERNISAESDACQALAASLDEMNHDWIIALRGYETLLDCLQKSGRASEVARTTEEFVSRHPRAEAILRARGE